MFELFEDWWWVIVLLIALWAAKSVTKKDTPPAEPPRALTADERRQVLELSAAGQKIAAIKLFREFTGCGLKDGKDAVEAMDAGN